MTDELKSMPINCICGSVISIGTILNVHTTDYLIPDTQIKIFANANCIYHYKTDANKITYNVYTVRCNACGKIAQISKMVKTELILLPIE